MDLNQLAAVAEAAIPYTSENYPALKGLVGEDALAFAINHTLLHQQKQIGKLAAVLEDRDHNSPWSFDQNELHAIGAKLLINAMRFCTLTGMTGDHAGRLAQALFPARD